MWASVHSLVSITKCLLSFWLQMPRFMSEGRTRDDEESVPIQPILIDLNLRPTKTENKKPEEVAGK